MSEPITYEIATVADFGKVPKRRLRACLKEFAVAVEMAHATEKLLQAIQRDAVKRGAIPEVSDFQWPMKTFRWTDDRKPGPTAMTISVKGPA